MQLAELGYCPQSFEVNYQMHLSTQYAIRGNLIKKRQKADAFPTLFTTVMTTLIKYICIGEALLNKK